MHWIAHNFASVYVLGFQRQVFKHVKILSERSKESKEQKKNKGSVLVAESAYNAQNAQFGLVMLTKSPFLTVVGKKGEEKGGLKWWFLDPNGGDEFECSMCKRDPGDKEFYTGKTDVDSLTTCKAFAGKKEKEYSYQEDALNSPTAF